MKILFLFLVVSLFIFSIGSVSAENIHIVKIPTGAGHSGAPYFWSVQSTGNTDGLVVVYPGDVVRWKNADTVDHTVFSSTLDGSDTLFFSNVIKNGESFSFQYDELGMYGYFCKLHPWMTGTVNVVNNPGSVQVIKNVASGLSEDGLGFDVRYFLDSSLSNDVKINPANNTVSFHLDGTTSSDEIRLILPDKLISNPMAVWVDGKEILDFNVELSSDGTLLTIPLDDTSQQITVMGTHVIPEFSSIVLILILIASFSFVILFTRKIPLRLN